jgi:hypothetical protein
LHDRPSRHERLYLLAAGAFACAAIAWLPGCDSPERLGYEIGKAPEVGFSGWDRLDADSCRGYVFSHGTGPANDVRVNVFYGTPRGEQQVVVIPENDQLAAFYGVSAFYTPAQVTNGELRYPRVGSVTCRGGSSRGQSRSPSLYSVTRWCIHGPDSLSAVVASGWDGWGYHVKAVVDIGTRTITVPVLPDPLPWKSDGHYVTPRRESSGVDVPPQLLRFEWEDYAGVAGTTPIASAWYGIFDCDTL